MSTPTLTQILQAANSGEGNLQKPAEAQLEAAQNANFPAFLLALCTELAGDDRPVPVRLLAGTQVKNALVPTQVSPERALWLAERWLNLPENHRVQLKSIILPLLANKVSGVRSQAARIIAAIAAIEIPKELWGDLIDQLLQSIMQTQNVDLRQAGFEALGYVCEEVPGNALQRRSPHVLNAIASGLTVEEKNPQIKLSAIRALVNSMVFVKANFENEQERNYIMSMIFTTATFPDNKVRVAAFSALIGAVGRYYKFMSHYISMIYQLTSTAIQNENEEIQRQAIEVWSVLSEEEINIQEEEALAKEQGEEPTRKSSKFIECAFPQLGPILLQCLTTQSGNINDDDWNLAKAASTCLGLCVNAGKDNIVPHVLPFIQQNIENEKWNFKEAAIMAYGAILDGPDRSKLSSLVKQTLPLILKQMQDTNPLVKDTTAWTLGRVCQFVPEALDTAMLPQLMQTCLNSLGDHVRIASKICYALHSLATAVEIKNGTSPLSPYLQDLLRALLTASLRGDVTDDGLLLDIFEVINDLVRTAAPDRYDLIGYLIPELQNRLSKTLTGVPLKDADILQASLCSTLSEIIRKLDKSVIVPQADLLMTYFVKVLHSKNAGTLAETLIAIGDIANRVGRDFNKYVSSIKDVLLAALSATDQINLCIVATGLVADISRAIADDFYTIGDEVMNALLSNLSNRLIDRAIKPHIISAFADIALSLRGVFERYNSEVLKMLIQASRISYGPMPDDDSADFLQNLRQGILEAYTGILSGLSEGGKKHLFAAPAPDVNVFQGLLEFFDLLQKEELLLNDGILSTATGLIGDLANEFGLDAIKLLASRASVGSLIRQAQASRDPATKEAAAWAQSKLL